MNLFEQYFQKSSIKFYVNHFKIASKFMSFLKMIFLTF